jgi:hypothetical protein
MMSQQNSPRGRLPDADRRMIGAALQALDGQTDEAVRGFREARAVYTDMRLPWRRALEGMVMVATLGAEHPEARTLVDETRALLAGMRAKPFIEQLDRLIAASPALEPSADGKTKRASRATAEASRPSA